MKGQFHKLKSIKSKLPDIECEMFAHPKYETIYIATKGHTCTRCASPTCKVRKAKCQ